MKPWPCLVVAALAATGCNNEPIGPRLAVTMDSASYARGGTGSAQATFTVTNVGDAPAFQQGCAKPTTIIVDKKAAGGWAAYVSTERCLGGGMGSQVVAPGQSYRDAFTWDLTGTYRIHVLYGAQPGDAYALQSAGPGFELR